MKKVWLSVLALTIGLAFALSFGACGGEDTEEEEQCTDTCETGWQCGKICDGAQSCGECPEGESCTDHMCVPEASDECKDKCGDAKCGEVDECVCGVCTDDETCVDGACVAADDCTAVCVEGVCGTIGECECGDTCTEDEYCTPENLCECDEVLACEGKDCGDNVCGTSCGECEGDLPCVDGICECIPDCEGKDCGPDGCSDQCGDCLDTEICQDGKCNVKSTDCPPEDPVFSDVVQKLNFMQIGKGGHPGEALDVDGDPDTCAPADDCEGGLNNQLSGLLGQLEQFVDADAEITTALEEGEIILLSENVDMKTDGSEFTINMYMGDMTVEKDVCDYQAVKCEYVVKLEALDLVTCLPYITFANATINDGKLFAGGPDSIFKFSIPIVEGMIFDIEANMATVTGDVVGEGDDMVIENGLIGGAVRKDKLMEAVDLIPEDEVDLPVSKEMIKNLLNMFVKPDVDTDDDGDPDAASIGVKYATIPGAIIGYEEAGE